MTTPSGKVIVIDPWLRTNPKTPPQFKNLEALGKVDLILVTHAHFDHVADAPDLAKMNNVPMYGPPGWAPRSRTWRSFRRISRRASARAAPSRRSGPGA